MKNLIVYYTLTVNTEAVAKELHKKVGGDLKKIEEEKQRKTGIGFAGAAVSALFGLKSKLKPMDFSLNSYDAIFIGGQVWAGHCTPAINAFIDKADFKNKNVYLFLTEADNKAPQKVIDSIKNRIEKRGGKFIESFYVTTVMGNTLSAEAIKELLPDWA